MDKKYCYFCYKTPEILMKATKNKSGTQYYSCRECARLRAKKYRETERGKERTRLAVTKSIQKYPNKQKARMLIKQAILSKKLTRPNECSHCHIKCNTEAHHKDYSKPLEVIWLCRACHAVI